MRHPLTHRFSWGTHFRRCRKTPLRAVLLAIVAEGDLREGLARIQATLPPGRHRDAGPRGHGLVELPAVINRLGPST